MHKIFAKPLFLGKKVVFLPQCHSTNDELVNMTKKSDELEGLVVYTDNQTDGRGQRGNIWFAEPGKNILMSLLLKPTFLAISDQFYLNLIAGLAIVDTLRNYTNAEVQLKWPNDVYLDRKKVCGILIESNLRGSTLESSVLGVGLNLNQKGFNLPNATSLTLETGLAYDKLEVLEEMLHKLEAWYLKLRGGNKTEILEAYHKLLMWKDEKHEFKANSTYFFGTIQGIDSIGKLIVTDVKGVNKTFSLKEIEFIS